VVPIKKKNMFFFSLFPSSKGWFEIMLLNVSRIVLDRFTVSEKCRKILVVEYSVMFDCLLYSEVVYYGVLFYKMMPELGRKPCVYSLYCVLV
jgi:hypothetical protein